jgi:lipoyl(octanoyl) transferase
MLEFITLDKTSNYQESVNFMLSKVDQVIANNLKRYVIFTQYTDLYTLGASADIADLGNVHNIPFYISDRGGKVTYHGPGQSIIYPVMHLSLFDRDLRKYLAFLASILISTFNDLGIDTYFCKERIGIWAKIAEGDKKIASIGIKIKKWVAYHGISVNIAPDMAKFHNIVACGISGYQQTSLKQLGLDISLEDFNKITTDKFTQYPFKHLCELNSTKL